MVAEDSQVISGNYCFGYFLPRRSNRVSNSHDLFGESREDVVLANTEWRDKRYAQVVHSAQLALEGTRRRIRKPRVQRASDQPVVR